MWPRGKSFSFSPSPFPFYKRKRQTTVWGLSQLKFYEVGIKGIESEGVKTSRMRRAVLLLLVRKYPSILPSISLEGDEPSEPMTMWPSLPLTEPLRRPLVWPHASHQSPPSAPSVLKGLVQHRHLCQSHSSQLWLRSERGWIQESIRVKKYSSWLWWFLHCKMRRLKQTSSKFSSGSKTRL